MLIALKCEKRKRPNIFKLLFGTPDRAITLEKKNILGSFYYMLTVRNKTGFLTEQNIERIIKNGYTKVVPIGGTELPEDCKIERFIPKRFYGQVIFSAFIKVLDLAKISPAKLKVVIYDRKGEFSHKVSTLLEYCSEVKILCENEEDYSECLEAAGNLMGAMVVATSDLAVLKSGDIIIAPDGWDLPISVDIPIFASKSTVSSEKIFTPGEIRIPDEIFREIEKADEREYFFSAVCELCPGGEKFTPEPLSLICDGREITATHAANFLKNLDK